MQSCQVDVVEFLESFPCDSDSVGGGEGVVAEFLDPQKPTRFGGGG